MPIAPELLDDAMRLVEQARQLLADGLTPQPPHATGHLLTSGDALRLLLQGQADDEAVAELGYPVAQARVVCLRAVSTGALDLLAERCHDVRRVVVARMTSETVAVFVPGTPRPTGVDASMRHAAAILTSLERTVSTAWNAGVSSPVAGASELAAAWQDATDAAVIAADTRRQRVAADDEWAAVTARRLRARLPICRTLNSGLDRLADYDADRNSDLGHTLGVWLRSSCDARTAAAALHIHVNTLRYRLARAAEVAGLDLSDPDQRLVVQLAYSKP